MTNDHGNSGDQERILDLQLLLDQYEASCSGTMISSPRRTDYHVLCAEKWAESEIIDGSPLQISDDDLVDKEMEADTVALDGSVFEQKRPPNTAAAFSGLNSLATARPLGQSNLPEVRGLVNEGPTLGVVSGGLDTTTLTVDDLDKARVVTSSVVSGRHFDSFLS